MIQKKWVDPDRVAYQKWLEKRNQNWNDTHKKKNFRDFTHAITPPSGYTQIGDAGQTIVFPVATDVAYGEGEHCFFRTGVIGSMTFDNATWSDPAYGKYKGAFAKMTPTVVANVPVTQSTIASTAPSASPLSSVQTGTTATPDTKSSSTLYIIIGAVVLIGGFAAYMFMKKKK